MNVELTSKANAKVILPISACVAAYIVTVASYFLSFYLRTSKKDCNRLPIDCVQCVLHCVHKPLPNEEECQN